VQDFWVSSRWQELSPSLGSILSYFLLTRALKLDHLSSTQCTKGLCVYLFYDKDLTLCSFPTSLKILETLISKI
jgi:hypothetical protein